MLVHDQGRNHLDLRLKSLSPIGRLNVLDTVFNCWKCSLLVACSLIDRMVRIALNIVTVIFQQSSFVDVGVDLNCIAAVCVTIHLRGPTQFGLAELGIREL